MILVIRDDHSFDIEIRNTLFADLNMEEMTNLMVLNGITPYEGGLMNETCNIHHFGDLQGKYLYSESTTQDYLRIKYGRESA